MVVYYFIVLYVGNLEGNVCNFNIRR